MAIINSISNVEINSILNDIIDCLIVSIGYEERSVNILSLLCSKAKEVLIFGYSTDHELSYDENLEKCKKMGFPVQDNLSDAQFRSSLFSNLDKLGNEWIHISVDVSSFNRTRLAIIIEFFDSYHGDCPIFVDFIYRQAKYSPPHDNVMLNDFFGPVTPYFAGMIGNPSIPTIPVIGLGYEKGKALGAIELLQAEEVWLLLPQSNNQNYSKAVVTANSVLLDSINSNNIIEYNLFDPAACWVILESLIHGLKKFSRPIFLPLGPKMFAVVSMLVATKHRDVGVWRVHTKDEPKNRKAGDQAAILRVSYSKGA